MDFSPLSSYQKDSIKQLLKTAVKLGAKYVEYDLHDHTTANIGTFYLENVPDAPFRLVATDNTNTMQAVFWYLPKDDQIGCIAHISSLIVKVCVTSEDAIEVKTNIEAAKRLVGRVKRTDLQSRLTKLLNKQFPCVSIHIGK
ncbi:Hypothetical predicted protein [Paramuricea clavata]|uniref:Uncharacterized protein n=1 Tax=Paramuricea clavata TaxID=317549 RepID=A0A6S7K3L4_PARCT|nr:Hypothetical predicted protein [Paramuricea clavata]